MKPYYEQDGITIYHGDCREVLPLLSAALVVTDPPYNVGKDYGVCKDKLPDEEYGEWLAEVVAMCRAAAPNQAWCVPKKELDRFAQWFMDGHLVVVRRGAAGPYRLGWSDQFDLLMTVGKPNRYHVDLWDDIRLKGEGYFFREETFAHPGYTPEPLMKRCIALLSEPGETIVDPFCGTGTALRAAKDLGRTAIGIELDERWCEIAAKRMAQGVLL